MSGDPLDLDGIEARANKVPGDIDWWVDGPALRSGKYWIYATGEKFESREVADHIAGMDPATTLALVAEVRRLRAVDERVNALAAAWNETPDYTPSDYDRGRVEQRHDMTTELLTIIERP